MPEMLYTIFASSKHFSSKGSCYIFSSLALFQQRVGPYATTQQHFIASTFLLYVSMPFWPLKAFKKLLYLRSQFLFIFQFTTTNYLYTFVSVSVSDGYFQNRCLLLTLWQTKSFDILSIFVLKITKHYGSIFGRKLS